MALAEARKVTLRAFCRLDELSAEEEELLGALYDAAVGYMTHAGVGEPPEYMPRRAQYDLCVNYLVLDSWDRRDASFVGTASSENPAFRRLLNQMKLTEPDVSNLDTTESKEGP
nr:head-tail connector protein [uncultured Oscillibacter sp.]